MFRGTWRVQVGKKLYVMFISRYFCGMSQRSPKSTSCWGISDEPLWLLGQDPGTQTGPKVIAGTHDGYYTQMLHVWNIYLHLSQKWPSYVGKYSIHGASGIVIQLFPLFPKSYGDFHRHGAPTAWFMTNFSGKVS